MRMKQWKSKVVLVVGMIFSAMCLMMVQDAYAVQRSPEAVAKQRANRFKKTLNLSDEQTERVTQTFVTFFTKTAEIKEADLTQAERKQRNQAAVKEREASFQEIMTPEQWNGLLEMRKKEKEHARQKRAQQNQ